MTQESTTLGDTASLPLFGIVQGTASATPTVPDLPANRADAIKLATVEIPAGATSLNSAGVVSTDVFPYTAMAGGTVVVRNSVELSAWTPASGARAFNLADNREYARKNGAWSDGRAKLIDSAGIVSAASGWSITSAPLVVSSTGVQLYVQASRIGPGITSHARGNITNTQVAQIDTQYAPADGYGTLSSSIHGKLHSGYINGAGDIYVTSTILGNGIDNGEEISLGGTWLL